MTKIVKRAISLFTVLTLAFTMCVTTGVSVFAEDENPDVDGIENGAEDTTEDGALEGDVDTAAIIEALMRDDSAEDSAEDSPVEVSPVEDVLTQPPIMAISAPIESDFYDVVNHWAAIAIDFVVRHGLFSGVGEGRFDPDAALTRGMLVTVLGRYDQAPVEGYWSSFADVSNDEYYAPYVAWAAQNGIVAGTGDSRFEPDAFVTREQVARIIASYIRYSSTIPLSTRVLSTYADEEIIADWALDDVNFMRTHGLMEGRPDGNFDPQGSLTRAEAAALFKRVIENAPINRLEG